MSAIQIVTLVTAIVGAVCGMCGAILGIINTCTQLSRNRVRLKVIPKRGYMVGGNTVITGVYADELSQQYSEQNVPSLWCIEVINL